MTVSTAISDTSARAGIDIHQFYSLDIKGAPAATLADVYEFDGTRGIGEPTKYTIRFTHPRHDLSRSEFLNRMGAFVIQPPPQDQWSQPEAALRVQGVVTGFALKAANRDQSLYEIVLESRLALLRNAPKCRFFLDMSIPEIIERILREHEFNKIFADFEFRLNRIYRKRSFVMQWGEDDLAFITRLCRRTGIWFVCDEGDRCERVRFGDDYAHYRRDPERLTVAYRPYSGLDASGVESVGALEMCAKTLPAAYAVRTFNTETAISDPIEAVSPIRDDRTTYGEAYTWGVPNQSEAEANEEAQLRRESALAGQVEYRGECDMLDLTPGSVLKLSNRELPDAKHGLVVVRVTCGASRKKAYHVTFDAIPSDRQYRMPLKEETWPRIDAVITGTIASSGGWKNPYIDSQGEYIVDLHLDRDTRTPGLQSCPMRLAKPFAGPNQTGFHFGLVEGTVVGVSFLWGCVDLPFISHVLHTAQHTDPIVAGAPWGTRNTIRTRSNNTLEMDDGEGREHIKVATEHGKSQLNLGHMVDRGQSERGSGAELRSDGPAALRGGGGVLVSAYARNGASGEQLDMQETVAQLEDALALAKALASSAQASKADAADIDSQRAANKVLDQGVLVTAPASAGVVAGKSVQVVAGENITSTARGDASWSVWKRFTVAAHDVVSLFTQKGMSLIAAAGAVVVQAQRGRMQLASQEDMTVETVNGVLHVKSSKEIVLNVGGSYFRMTPGGIEMGTRGEVLFKAGKLKKTGPAQMDLGGAAFAPTFVPYTTGCEVWRTNPAFVPPHVPATEVVGLESAGTAAPAPDASGVAPSPLGDFFSHLSGGTVSPGVSVFSPFDGNPSNVDTDIPKAKVTLNNSDDRKQTPVTPDPIKLANAVPCDWKISDLKADVKGRIESLSYWGVLNDRTSWKDPETGVQYRGGGSRDSYFEFAYSEQEKAITCTVRVMLIPMDLFRVDLKGDRDTSMSTEEATIPYEYSAHSTMASGSTRKGVRMDYRDAVGTEFDVRALIGRIEAVLNQGNYKLILDGCSKGAACGCRVKVHFKVDLRVSLKGVPIKGFNPHVSINLFPQVLRADTGSWGERHKWKDELKIIHSYPDANVEAHECGHYFNFPDEYYDQGGWLHHSYIKDEQIDFSLVDAKAGAMFWQGYSIGNVMGGGANSPVQSGRITATIKPYYLEYVRRQFSIATNKLWRVGYEE
ncbi:type VI secretion system Vgr family protein [Burkholderia lata]|uniref:VgrG protein n=1 Tax=Burkholderia lata (strain ATCC 17760 / DSM 23089 / LMG 22485 / NCIMB 9086 / R18194 / 383) TaxID=482957 RepID=A0A6P2SQ50_BURL3|nr:type VI secretion system Vgr family protein [Burkholderia lata]VWB04700.1 VgrG protein [Burkholderia lata]VWC51847.1 VgrG protein [Burkholderia lata]